MARRYGVARRLRFLTTQLIEGVLTVGAALALSLAALYFGKMLWWVYMQTPLGREFTVAFPAQSSLTQAFFAQDLVGFAVRLNGFIAGWAFALAVVAQILYFKTLFYDNRELLARVCFWIIPFASLIALTLVSSHGLGWHSSFLISIVPCSLLLNYLMNLTSKILPEGLLLNGPYKILYRIVERIRCILKNCIQACRPNERAEP